MRDRNDLRQRDRMERCTVSSLPQAGAGMNTSGILKVVYAIILVVVTAALGASFTHMHDWTMHVLPDDTPTEFGWVNAIISELTPLAGSLYLMHVHRRGGPKWPAWVMLLYGFTASAIGQVHAAGTDPSFWALVAALLPVVSAFILIKVLFILLDQNSVDTPVPEDLDQVVQATPDQVVQPDRFTADQSMVHPADQLRVHPVVHPDRAVVDQPWSAGQGLVHPVDQAVDQPLGHPVDQGVNHPLNQPVDRPENQVVHEPVQPVAVPWSTLTDDEKAGRLAEAVQLVQSGELSQNQAAKRTGVPKSNLRRAVDKASSRTAAPAGSNKAPSEPVEAIPSVDELAELFAMPSAEPQRNTDEG